jgi:putative membrane protein
MKAPINRLLYVALLVAPVSLMAQSDGKPSDGKPDATFGGQLLTTLHEANLMEIAAGQLALTHSSSAAVKQFGAELVRDHSAADEQVTAMAAKRNVPLPPAKEDDGVKRLAGLRDEAFDAVFASMMIDDHIKAIALVRSAQKRVAEPQLAAFLKTLLPTLEKHRDAAMALGKS